MIAILRRPFQSKIGMIAGYQSADYKAANIIHTLKKINPEAQFFGIAGEKMLAEDPSFKSCAKISHLTDKPFYPYFGWSVDPRFYLHIPLIYSHIKSALMLRELNKNNFFEEFNNQKGKEVDMMITVGNELFALRLFKKLQKIHESKAYLKPLTIHVDSTIRNMRFDHTSVLDFYVYTTPLTSPDPQKFAFPSKFVGKSVVFEALSFIYKQNPQFSDYVTPDSLTINPHMNILIVEEIAFEMRRRFRESRLIPDSTFLFFISPGSEESEIQANLKVAVKAVNVFIEKFTKDNRFTKKNFGVILSLPDNQRQLRSLSSKFEASGIWTHTIIGNQDGERYMAMAGSDLAAVANGDSVFESSVFQLPTVILDNSPFLSAYLKLMYNVYGSEFNWNGGAELLPETLGRNFGAKVSEFWEAWFLSPKSRFKLARRINRHLLNALPQSIDNDQTNIEDNAENKELRTYLNPQLVLRNFLEEIYLNFKDVKMENVSRTEQEERRRVLVLGPEFSS